MSADLPCVTLSPRGSLSVNRAAARCLAPEDQLDGLRVSLAYQPEANVLSVCRDPVGLFLLRDSATPGQAPTFRIYAKTFFEVHKIAPSFATRFVFSPGDTEGTLSFELSHGVDARRGSRDSQALTRRRHRLAEPGVFEHLGLALRLVRNSRGVTLNELSRRTKIPEPQLRLYETGKYLPSLPELSALLLALDISTVAFFYALRGVSQASAATQSEPSRTELLQGLPCPLCSTDPEQPSPGGSQSN